MRLQALIAILVVFLVPCAASAGLIRDAEVEATLAAYSKPIFVAAGIEPESVHLFVVQDSQINAYVAGGLNIFLNTGLILKTPKPGMLIGVIAHETGHIAGAHLSQLREKSTRAMIGSIVGAAIGAVVIAGGGGQAGAGVIAGSQGMAQRSLLTEIRLNESSADQAALKYLDASDISASGALEMFQILKRYELQGARDPFMSSHPLTTERITAMRNHLQASDIPADQVPSGFDAMHARMLAKLLAFMEPYEATLARYPASDVSVAARYARAIAEFRRGHLEVALKGMDGLIKESPKDPYFYDTRGQMLFENGRIPQALDAYAKAASFAPNSALILTEYAKVIIASDTARELPHALLLLERARDLDDSYAVTWRQFALAYGKQGKMGLSYAALAEEAALQGDWRTSLQHVARARTEAKNDHALLLTLDDLERDAKAQLEKKREESIF